MRYETIKNQRDGEFKRSTGGRRTTCENMLTVMNEARRDVGRPPKLNQEDQRLMTLMYWREYRTEFHIGLAYGVSASTVCRTIRKVEHVLIASRQFHLPGKKKFYARDLNLAIVVVDATEQPIERPKKNSGTIRAAQRNVILKTPK